MRPALRPALGAALVLLVLAPALRALPRDPTAEALAAAQAALDADDPDGALRLVAPVLQREPRNARALLVRSTAACMLGDLAACTKDLDRALELDPKLRQGWLNRSALALADGKYDDALAALARAEALDPDAADNAINQGAVHLLKGDLETATARFRRQLERQPANPGAWYLVASNYAGAGYAALALEHLSRAVALDERTRVRARTDPNFAGLAANRDFQQFLDTDSWTPPPGTASAERVFRTRYSGSDSPIVTAVLNALQLADAPLESSVEIAPDWALFWAQFRIQLVRNRDDSTTVRLFSRPEHYFPPTWDDATAEFFRALETQLLKLELAASRQPPGGSPHP
jgi:tetratricopeptide (TPR) repeat protein